MFTVTSDATLMRGAAGESNVIQYQLADENGVIAPLNANGTSLVLTFYDGVTEPLFYANAEVLRDRTGDYAEWVMDGTISNTLRNKSNVRVEIAERLARGSRATLTTMMLQIDPSAPRIDSYDNGPVAHYATRIVRKFDPTSGQGKPDYVVSILDYNDRPVVTAGKLTTSYNDPDSVITYFLI